MDETNVRRVQSITERFKLPSRWLPTHGFMNQSSIPGIGGINMACATFRYGLPFNQEPKLWHGTSRRNNTSLRYFAAFKTAAITSKTGKKHTASGWLGAFVVAWRQYVNRASLPIRTYISPGERPLPPAALRLFVRFSLGLQFRWQRGSDFQLNIVRLGQPINGGTDMVIRDEREPPVAIWQGSSA